VNKTQYIVIVAAEYVWCFGSRDAILTDSGILKDVNSKCMTVGLKGSFMAKD
jgi:hypothetical protein